MRRFTCTSGGRGVAFALLFVGAVLSGACRDGEIAGPMASDPGPTLAATAAAPLSFRQVSIAAYPGTLGHACGVTSADVAYCWGANESGELGIAPDASPEECSTYRCSSRPVAVQGGLRFRHVVAGNRYSCGVTNDFRTYCWGRNFEGQLGNPAPVAPGTPVKVSGGQQFRQVRPGDNHTCAITRTNVAYCWGWNSSGELGDGTTTQRFTPVRVAGGLSWTQLSAGYAHTCGVTTANKAYCWGSNGAGTLGDGTRTNRSRPKAVSGELAFEQIDGGFNHTCGVTTAGRGYCWGANGGGELGNNTRISRLTPTLVYGQRLYDNVSAGFGHTCGVTRAGKPYCWGSNGAGQLGIGSTTTRRLIPTPLGVSLTVTQVVATYGSSCTTTTTQRAYCWGDNSYGQLGDGTTTWHSLPTAVAGPS